MVSPLKSGNLKSVFVLCQVAPHPRSDDSHILLQHMPSKKDPAVFQLRRSPFRLPSTVSGTSGNLLMLRATSTLII